MKFCYGLLVHIFTGILSASRKPMVAFSSSELIFSTLSSGPTSLDLDSIPIPRTMILRKKNILFVKFRGQLFYIYVEVFYILNEITYHQDWVLRTATV